MNRVAFVHVTEPGFTAGGAEIRTTQLYRAVRERWPEANLTMIPGVRHAPWTPSRARAAVHGIPPRLSRLYDAATVAAVREAIADSDLAVASTTFTASLVRRSQRSKVVLDAHNIESRVTKQLSASSGAGTAARRLAYLATTSWTRGFEAHLARSVAGVWAVSKTEAAWFAQQGARVWVVPNGVEVPSDSHAPAGEKGLLFVGSLNSVFNRQGLEWFVSQVWPEVRRAIPDARLEIAGSGPPLDLPQGVGQLGFVEDLGPLYSRATACVAPLLGGAGTRLKVLEAMAHCRPVVTTSIGAEGLDVTHEEGVFRWDDPRDFAEECRRLLSDPAAARVAGRKARSKAVEYGWDRIAAVAFDSLKELSLRCL